MSTRSWYDSHTYLCHAIFASPGDQLTLSTISPRYNNARSGCTRYKAKLPSLSSGCTSRRQFSQRWARSVSDVATIHHVHQSKTPETKTINKALQYVR